MVVGTQWCGTWMTTFSKVIITLFWINERLSLSVYKYLQFTQHNGSKLPLYLGTFARHQCISIVPVWYCKCANIKWTQFNVRIQSECLIAVQTFELFDLFNLKRNFESIDFESESKQSNILIHERIDYVIYFLHDRWNLTQWITHICL